ncbi:hypothetical protein Tco_0601100, partial [Tanacetum coccineum]
KGFLSPKGKRSGKGVKEKQSSSVHDPSKANNSANFDYGTSTNANKNMELNDVNDPLVNLLDKSNGTLNELVVNMVENSSGHVLNDNTKDHVSFAKLFKGDKSGKVANFRTLLALAGNGADVAVSLGSVQAVHERFSNTAYGSFLGKRVAYLVVENYVKNIGGSLYPSLDYVHDIPITAFTEDGLSVIDTKLGTLLMLVSYTMTMCMESWCKLSYARAMIKLRADVELKHSLMVAVPKLEGEGYIMYIIYVEYEWTPSRCSSCKIGSKTKFAYRPKAPRRLKVTNDKKNSTVPSTSNSFNVINEMERQVLDGKLVLLDDVGKPLKSLTNVASKKASKASKSDSGVGNKSLHEKLKETYDEDPYDDDDFDDRSLTYKQMAFANAYDISLKHIWMQMRYVNKIAFFLMIPCSIVEKGLWRESLRWLRQASTRTAHIELDLDPTQVRERSRLS